MAGLPPNFRAIRKMAEKRAETITLGQLMRSRGADGQSLIKQGRWLREHVPIRFARRVNDFVQLPYHVVQNESFNAVYSKYLRTFNEISSFPEIRTIADEQSFCDLVNVQLELHKDVAPLVSQGYSEVRHMYPHTELDDFLSNLFATRISTRILFENYIDMRNPLQGHPGVVTKDLSPLEIIQGIARELVALTKSVYGCSPNVEFIGNLNCTLDYIPRHMLFMVQEILKNALRATTERHRSNGGPQKPLPSVVVELQKGDVTVIIKISDQGGGMPKTLQQQAWKFGWTSVSEEGFVTTDPDTWPGGKLAIRRKELAGYGFGLPLTRLYAQYFGGDVFMQALSGHGTDMYLLLNHLKEGSPSVEIDDPATALTENENSVSTAP